MLITKPALPLYPTRNTLCDSNHPQNQVRGRQQNICHQRRQAWTKQHPLEEGLRSEQLLTEAVWQQMVKTLTMVGEGKATPVPPLTDWCLSQAPHSLPAWPCCCPPRTDAAANKSKWTTNQSILYPIFPPFPTPALTVTMLPWRWIQCCHRLGGVIFWVMSQACCHADLSMV